MSKGRSYFATLLVTIYRVVKYSKAIKDTEHSESHNPEKAAANNTVFHWKYAINNLLISNFINEIGIYIYCHIKEFKKLKSNKIERGNYFLLIQTHLDFQKKRC